VCCLYQSPLSTNLPGSGGGGQAKVIKGGEKGESGEDERKEQSGLALTLGSQDR
jgi:hypothetical protein